MDIDNNINEDNNYKSVEKWDDIEDLKEVITKRYIFSWL